MNVITREDNKNNKQQRQKEEEVISVITATLSAKQAKGGGRGKGGFCRGFSDCLVMGSTQSRRRHHHHQCPPGRPQATSTTHIEKQLAEIEIELKKQRDAKTMYKMKLERVQDYLRHCLQIAQDNGFLNLIIGIDNKSKHDHQQSLHPLTSDKIISEAIILNNLDHQIPNPVQDHSYLALLMEQAKMFGWYIEPKEIELQEKVAQGTTADVYRGRWRGSDVAVKCILPELFESNENMFGFFAQEVETLARQRHPFVLQLMGACLEPPNHGWIVTEFLNTNLNVWMHGHGRRRKERTIPVPPLKDRLEKALEISQAMQYLHQHKPMILHRDLKPSNIFLDHDMHVKVADFGHARFLTDGEKALTGETGTYVYMAPEVIRCTPYDEKSDVYSFGVILNELITGDHPYIETNYGPSKIAMEVANNGLRPALPKDDENNNYKELIEIVENSWDEDSERRPIFAEITFCLRNFLEKLPDLDFSSTLENPS